MNLYKLLVDSGLTSNVRCFKEFIKADEDFEKLDNYRKTSRTLRIAVGHNPTSAEISAYKRWLKSTIKRNEVKCENDYKIALVDYYFKELEEKLGNALMKIKTDGVGSMEPEDIIHTDGDSQGFPFGMIA